MRPDKANKSRPRSPYAPRPSFPLPFGFVRPGANHEERTLGVFFVTSNTLEADTPALSLMAEDQNAVMGDSPETARSPEKVHHTVTACVRCRQVGLSMRYPLGRALTTSNRGKRDATQPYPVVNRVKEAMLTANITIPSKTERSPDPTLPPCRKPYAD